MSPSRARAIALGFCLALLALPALGAPRAPVEFWVIEPNEGGSAGGHAALRIGEIVHHVQRRPDGLLSDERTPRSAFERIYRGLGNRGIEVIPLALTTDESRHLRERVEARRFRRRRELDRLDALDESVGWLDRSIARGAAEWILPGLGLAEASARGCDAPRARHLAAFRARLAERWGAGWLSERREAARRALDEGLDAWLRATSRHDGAPDEDEGASALDRLQDIALRHEALRAIETCSTTPDARLVPIDRDPAADSDAVLRWQPVATALEARLLALVESRRPDAGLAILLTTARWTATLRSIETGRLHVVRTRADEAPRPIRGGLTRPDLHTWVTAAEARVDHAARALADGPGPLEARFAALEHALHHLEHARARTLHRPPAASERAPALRERPFAAATAAIRVPIADRRGDWIARRDALQEAAQRARGDARRALGYGLFSRNCVTELTGLLGDASDASDAGHPQGFDASAVLDALDGTIDFVPAVAARRMARHPAARPAFSLPSARRERVRAATASGAIGARWRELSPLTSRTYRPHAEDSSFLFFTRDTPWARPLLGLGNLVWATAATTAGVLSAPFDRGERLQRGGHGMLMSVPEFFFFSVRQGSYPIVPPSFVPEEPSPAARMAYSASDADPDAGCGAARSACARDAR